MNQFIAPINCDLTHHRNHFEPSVRAALGVLDRVEEGQNVSARDVELALQVTGDAQPLELRAIESLRANPRGRWQA